MKYLNYLLCSRVSPNSTAQLAWGRSGHRHLGARATEFNRVAAAQTVVYGYAMPEFVPLAYDIGDIQCLFSPQVSLCEP